MKKTFMLLGLLLILAGIAPAQHMPANSPSDIRRPNGARMPGVMSQNPKSTMTSQPCFYKRKSEWQKIIDSTWGSGLPTAQKLSVFDTYSSFVRANNPTFAYTHLNWDSVSSYWRSKITDSTSEGAFSAVLSALARELNDLHAWAFDGVLFGSALNPGTPILAYFPLDVVGWSGGVSHFGAGLTPLPDSSLLVYMVVPKHPLALEPGDVVLGYEGIPWRSLYRELIGAGIPSVPWNGTSVSSRAYNSLICAGMNWHLFDTIDIVKYNTGDTVHLATDTLASLAPVGGQVNGAQLPIAGVPMPGWSAPISAPLLSYNSFPVTYGIIQGTDIGYIYVYHEGGDIASLFNQAVAALSQTHGLIIDIRFNAGGILTPNDGIARLTSYAGPTLQLLARNSSTDLSSLVPVQLGWDFTIPQDYTAYPYPVAVLLGPTCASLGDYASRQLRYLDNVRFFGEPPQSAYAGLFNGNEPQIPGFILLCPVAVAVDAHAPNTQIWGTEFPVDEHVWLTRDGVAKGVDDVVQSAIKWITTVSFAHHVSLEPLLPRKQRDTVRIRATVQNPLNHSLTVTAFTEDLATSRVQDSLSLFNDGLHGDGLAGDTLWGGAFVPSTEGVYGVSVRTDDPVSSTSRTLPNAAIFATAGPVTYAGYHVWQLSPDSVIAPGSTVIVLIGLKNMGTTGVIPAVTGSIAALDSQDVTGTGTLSWGNLYPGAVVYSSTAIGLQFGSGRRGGSTASFAVNILSHGVQLWEDTMSLVMTGIEVAKHLLPTSFSLAQNYPNPFNPSTAIDYDLPKSSVVRLSVYDILGREVSVLVNERENVGSYEVRFDGSRLSSGIYFYRIQAGNFVQVKKLVILK